LIANVLIGLTTGTLLAIQPWSTVGSRWDSFRMISHSERAAEDSVRAHRVTVFLEQLSEEWPHLAASWDTSRRNIRSQPIPAAPTRDAQRDAQRAIQLERIRAWQDAQISGSERIDSLRVLWPQIDSSVRATVVFGGSGMLRSMIPALLDMAAESVALNAIARLAAAMDVTRRGVADRTEMGDIFRAYAPLVAGQVALVRGDTTRALALFWDGARVQIRSGASAPVEGAALAASRLARLAEVRHDTTTLIRALTLQRLLLPVSWNTGEGLVVDARLQELYSRAVATGRMPPLPLETYLDRQWTLLYDRAFPVESVRLASTAPSHGVVIEYMTGIDCHGCWGEDRVASAIAQRYPAERVIPLAYLYSIPTVNANDNVMDRFDAWYPRSWDTTHTSIARATLLTATGDTVRTLYHINGRGVPKPLAADSMTDSVAWRARPVLQTVYQRFTQQIDRELARPPAVRLRVEAAMRADTLVVTTRVDSLQGSRPALALRLVLIQDTVRVRMGTVRRLYFNVVRADAHAAPLSMGVPCPAPGTPLRYVFDLAAIQAGMLMSRDANPIVNTDPRDNEWAIESRDGYLKRFPDRRDWQLDRAHLAVVAFVQDLTTGEVLQVVRLPVPQQ